MELGPLGDVQSNDLQVIRRTKSGSVGFCHIPSGVESKFHTNRLFLSLICIFHLLRSEIKSFGLKYV